MPSAAEFYDQYIHPERPVMLRGFASQMPAATKWLDDFRFSEEYGNLSVLTEVKHEDRTADPQRTTIREFVGSYQASTARYIVSVIPEPLAKDAWVFPFITCGTFRERLQETNLWMSSGDTVSYIHNDADNIINCVLDGEKRWKFVHPDQKPMLYMNSSSADEDDLGEQLQRSDFSDVNASAVDLDKFPLVSQARFREAVARKGDCLYLPPGYGHQVTTPPGRSMAVTYMFMPLMPGQHFREASASCYTDGNKGFEPFDKAPFRWRYSGSGRVPMGYMDPTEIRAKLYAMLAGDGQEQDGTLLEDEFIDSFVDNGGGEEETAARVWELLVQAAGGGRESIDREAVDAYPERLLMQVASIIDDPHGDDGSLEIDWMGNAA